MSLIVVGLSHKTAPVELREKLAIPKSKLGASLASLNKEANLSESVILSTCNRVEVYGRPLDNLDKSAKSIWKFFNDLFPHKALQKSLYQYDLNQAVSHLFRVASGLDSLVVGESEILGQVKEAYLRAKDNGVTGKITNVLFQRALFIGKKVRSETTLSAGASSVGSVAVHLAERIFGDLSKHRVLILGAGEIAEVTSRHFMSQKVKSITILNRSIERAKSLAKKLDGRYGKLEDLHKQLSHVDIVVASTASDEPLITYLMVNSLMDRRKHKPIYFIDLAVPRNVEARIHELDNVYVYNVDDLRSIVEESLAQRKREVGLAEKIVLDATNEFADWIQAALEGRHTGLKHKADS